MKTKEQRRKKVIENYNKKDAKGITLVALVVTIIILIILAGVSISLVLGDNGIVSKAKDAKQNMEVAANEEQEGLANLEVALQESLNGGSSTPQISINDLKAGNYIKYDTGVTNVGENGVITCRVLYEASSPYGLQIISDKNIKQKIDGVDTEITVTLGGSDWATASASYNSAIGTLNRKAEDYLNTKYATDARCVGSIPTVENGIFKNKNSENAGPVELQFESTVEGANSMKDTDKNYTTDETQMKAANIWTTEQEYWLASRNVDSGSFICHFTVRSLHTSGNLSFYSLCSVYSGDSTDGYSSAAGLRPCFSLRSDIKITGGNGTEETPYTM